MTKKEARARKAAWNQAIREGRVVRFATRGFNPILGNHEVTTFRSYPDAAQAALAVEMARGQGTTAKIVDPTLAQE